MPGGRLSTLARAMRERAQFDAPAVPGEGTRSPGGAIPSPGGAPGRAGRRVVSRRGLLRMGGAFGVSAALAACTTRSSPAADGTSTGTPTAAHGVRVAVIGAGLAGTTAAYRLARSGVQVRLFEARDRIGGRCWTARGFADGQTAEHGGEFIDTRHVHLRGLATELGLQLDDLWQGDVPDAISPSWINGGYFDYYDKFYAQLDRITTAVKAAARQVGVIGPQRQGLRRGLLLRHGHGRGQADGRAEHAGVARPARPRGFRGGEDLPRPGHERLVRPGHGRAVRAQLDGLPRHPLPGR